jgi:hypothetical protein
MNAKRITSTVRIVAVIATLFAAHVAARALTLDAPTQSHKIRYEAASDAEVAAYFADGQEMVRCVAANTATGCK